MDYMHRGSRAIEMLLDVDIQNGLEGTKPTVLNNAKDGDEGAEDEMIHLA